MIGLGVEQATELADETQEELKAKLRLGGGAVPVGHVGAPPSH